METLESLLFHRAAFTVSYKRVHEVRGGLAPDREQYHAQQKTRRAGWVSRRNGSLRLLSLTPTAIANQPWVQVSTFGEGVGVVAAPALASGRRTSTRFRSS